MADDDLRAGLGQPLGGGIDMQIGAADAIAEVQQHFGDAAHAGTADADEMDMFDLVLHFAASLQILATASVASGLPSARAFSAMSSNCPRVHACRRAAKPKGVSSSCRINTAAPASAR